MTLPEFLLARCAEALDDIECRYAPEPGGGLLCLCEHPDEQAREVLARMDLIRSCIGRDSSAAELTLRLLADAHATHADYQVQWHRIALS